MIRDLAALRAAADAAIAAADYAAAKTRNEGMPT